MVYRRAMDDAASRETSAVTDPDPVHGVLNGLFSLRGYLSRQYFLMRWALLGLPALVVAGVGFADAHRPSGQPRLLPSWFIVSALAGFGWTWACMQAQRLRDANLPPMWAVVGFIPYVGLLAI